MSIEALKWANDQRCATSSAQFLLEKLAWWADPEGRVRYVDPDYIAEHTIQSRSNVFRHLAEFETHGVFERVRTVDDEGVVTTGGRLRLDKSLILPRASKGAKAADATGAGGESHHATGVAPCDSGSGVAPCDSDESHHATPSYIRDLDSKESSPLPPGGEPGANEGFSEKKFEDDFAEFAQRYPMRAWMSPQGAKAQFGRLSLADRAKALRWAPEVAKAVKADGRKNPIAAEDWLRKREFEGLAAIAKAGGGDAGVKAPQVFVRRGTDAWKAWWEHKRRTTGQTIEPFFYFNKIHGCEGREQPSLFPPREHATGPPAA